MARSKSVIATLMCAVFVLVFAAPLVQSEGGEVHLIYKDENGPPSTCAETWVFTPSEDGTWTGHVVNYGMRWIIIDMEDDDTGAILIDRHMYRFAVEGNEFDTEPIAMTVGHAYRITVTPNGPLYTSVTVEDVFEGSGVPNEPPVADFTVSVDGLTVSVDASASHDDGTIVSYAWNWGDGSTDTGMVASHTYTAPDTRASYGSGPVVEDDIPDPPYLVCGYTYASDGVTKLPDCTVTITNTNVTSGWSTVVSSGAISFYNFDISVMGYTVGDTIHVEAVKGDYVGESEGVIAGGSYMQLDISLVEEAPPPPFEVTITLTVTDDDGATATLSKTVTLQP